MNRAITIVCPVYGGPPKGGADKGPSNRFEAAQNGPTNRKHWANADDFGPLVYANSDVRRHLRRRGRYERDNDPHLDGLITTLAHDLIGTGPRLQLALGDEHEDDAALVEASFAAWCLATNFSDKLRQMHEGRVTDGESFARLITDDNLASPVKLDVLAMEAEMVQTPGFGNGVTGLVPTPRHVDGIEFDAAGKPSYYHVLKSHPGDGWAWGLEHDRTPARLMCHWFRPRRAGQARGVSELASALEVGAQTRRYGAAVLTAAEFAAMLAGVLEQDTDPGSEGITSLTDWNEVEMTRGALLTLPRGTKASQFKPEQPTLNHGEYEKGQLNKLGRAHTAPRNLVTGDSSDFNFASGKLDHLPYQRRAWIERNQLRLRVLDRVLLAWYAEAQLIGLIPAGLPAVNEWLWDWQWDGFPSINPLQDATADEMQLKNNTTTLAEICAAKGTDWRTVIRQRAKERALMLSLGLNPDPDVKPVVAQPNRPAPAEDPAGV